MESTILSILLKSLPVVGPVIAALPEFKALYDLGVQMLDKNTDQATAKEAYALAFDKAGDAHDRLQALVAKHGA